MTGDEFREATRGLKGSMLRQEIYALDGTAQETEPYSVVQKNHTIQILQPRGTSRSIERESVRLSYD
ncbi:hypothetical protein LTS15_010984 [Exophiala xenobiotica]|nr:hypothetical protein LTS15_010984 [Exophiala xenobiotica]